MAAIALVSGANRGIGDCRALQLDVTDVSSVERAIATIRADVGRLDVLVNNAGRTIEVPAFETGAAVLRDVFATNVYGAATLFTAALPLLRHSTASRVVIFVTG